jgi:tetratricopeptide (TPR) repeat protein
MNPVSATEFAAVLASPGLPHEAAPPTGGVGLVLVVADDVAALATTMDSVRELISHWLIVHTGSDEALPAAVNAALDGVPGQLLRAQSMAFGQDRTEALRVARPAARYSLLLEAGETVELAAGASLPELSGDAVHLAVRQGGLVSWQPRLVSNRFAWRDRGVVRSHLEGAEASTRQFAPDLVVHTPAPDTATAQQHAAALEAAWQVDPENAGLAHELATAYRVAEQYESAGAAYRRALNMGGTEQEVADAMLWSARLLERSGARPEDVIAVYLKAFQAHPARAEALVDLARFCRDHKLYDLARMAAGHALGIPMPREESWAEEEVYSWRALDEYAVASYWTGHEVECVAACRNLLADSALPAAHRPRVEANLNAAEAKLGAEVSRTVSPAVLPRQANRDTADDRATLIEAGPVEVPALTGLLSPQRSVSVMLIGVEEPAGDLMARQLCEVTRFEPLPERYEAVRELALPRQTVLPYALGDGGERSVWSGVHPAEPRVLETFGWLHQPAGDLLTVATRKLDDIEHAAVDLLHIDLRHADLAAFQHGRNTLAGAVAVQARIALIALHPDQPSLGEFDLAARALGLVPHAITVVERTGMAPWGEALHQVSEAEVVYVRDFTRPELMSDDQLTQLALVAHHCWGSHDLALRCLLQLELRGTVALGAAETYRLRVSPAAEVVFGG